MKKMKKTAALLIAMALMGGILPQTAPFAVYAEEQQAENLQKVILAVKEKISIPQELEKFTPHTSQDGDTTSYRLTWKNEDDNHTINVSTDENGNIFSYFNYDYEKSDEVALKISKEQAQAAADAFIKKALPERFADETDRLEAISAANAGGLNSYNFCYIREKDGIPVSGNQAEISVISLDGQPVIQNMRLNWYDAAFTGEATMDEEQLREAYKKEFPLELHYRSTYGKDKSVLMEYDFTENQRYVSAADGTQVTYRDPRTPTPYPTNVAGGGAAMDSAASLKEEAELNRAEMEEINAFAGMLAPEEVRKKILSISALKADKDAKLLSSSAYKDVENEMYFMNIRCEKDDDASYSFTVDAKTGELYRYYQYSADFKSDDNKPLTDAQKKDGAEKIAAFVKAQSPQKAEQLKKDESENGDSRTYVYESWTRLVNGIPYLANTISGTWNVTDDKLDSYSVTWDKLPAELADPAKAVGEAKAYAALLEAYPLHLMYVHTADGYVLCAGMAESGDTYVDALTGEITDYRGKPLSQQYTAVSYTDLDGHWAKNAVVALSQVGIGLPGEEFKPDQTITQGELLYMLLCVRDHYAPMPLYDYARIYEAGGRFIPTEVQNPEAPVTRQEAVKYILTDSAYSEAAELPGIFKTGFADEADIDTAYMGYVAIAQALGIVKGDGSTFCPREEITRAQAATMFYNYLMR